GGALHAFGDRVRPRGAGVRRRAFGGAVVALWAAGRPAGRRLIRIRIRSRGGRARTGPPARPASRRSARSPPSAPGREASRAIAPAPRWPRSRPVPTAAASVHAGASVDRDATATPATRGRWW